jgi:hypothetical protein
LSFERITCKAPNGFAVATTNEEMPQDVPIAIALTNDEYDPWTETSVKYRIYE